MLLQNIFFDELLGKKKLCCLSWDVGNKDANNFTYERNINSKAYIVYNGGEQYYRGGFNGGCKKGF